MTDDDVTQAVCIIRASQGDDAKDSLRDQRDRVPARAHDLSDKVDRIDLGIHTGFTTFERDPAEYDRELLDQNPEIKQLEEDLEDGVYDYVVARDEKRVARSDTYTDILLRAARRGDAEFVFTDSDIKEMDSMSAEVARVVERHSKQQEIEAAKRAVRRRQENGYYQGGAWFGLEFTDDGRYLTRSNDFDRAMEVLEIRDSGHSYREIRDETGVALSTQKRVLDRREVYEAIATGHMLGADGIVETTGP